MEFLQENLAIVLPIVIVEVLLMVFALRDIFRSRAYRVGNRTIWVIVVIFVQIIGPILYFVLGKENSL